MKIYYNILVSFLLCNGLMVAMQLSHGEIALPDDSVRHVVSYLDLPSANAFFRTCTSNYHLYDNSCIATTPIDCYLLANKNQCFLLSKDEHCDALIHYSQLGDQCMIEHLIKNENHDNTVSRRNLFTFFNRSWDRHDIENVMSAYKGIMAGEKTTAGSGYLHYVVSRDGCCPYDDRAVRVLVRNYVDPNDYKDNNHMTALHWAVSHKRMNAVSLLINAGADLYAKDKRGNTPFYKAFPHLEMMFLFVKAGVDVNIQDNDGRTLLHRAVEWNNKEAVCFLLEHGATNFSAANGKTPFDVACELGYKEIQKLFIKEYRLKKEKEEKKRFEERKKEMVYLLTNHYEKNRYQFFNIINTNHYNSIIYTSIMYMYR